MTEALKRAKAFRDRVANYQEGSAEFFEALHVITDLIVEYDPNALNKGTNLWWEAVGGFDLQGALDNIIEKYTNYEIREEDQSNTHKYVTFYNMDEPDDTGSVSIYAVEGTPRRLQMVDFWMAVFEGRTSESARGFLHSWLHARFTPDNRLDFKLSSWQKDPETGAQDYCAEPYRDMFIELHKLCKKTDYLEDCFVGEKP